MQLKVFPAVRALLLMRQELVTAKVLYFPQKILLIWLSLGTDFLRSKM